MYELVNIFFKVSEEGRRLAYAPCAVFLTEFVIRIHICPFLYPGVRFRSAARNLPTLFASSVVDTAAGATTRHSDEQVKNDLRVWRSSCGVYKQRSLTLSVGEDRPERTTGQLPLLG
jgi:hypothetical protein